MKKRTILAGILLMILLCFSATACTSLQGKSAYDIACDNGFVGTEQEWLESLNGKDGKDGSNGKDGQNGNDGQNGQNGQDAAEIDIFELFDAYLSENEGASFADFLKYFSIVNYYDTEYATAKGIQSAVSVWSTFTQKITKPGQSSEYSAAGSGVVYKIENGDVYIITNYHVIYDRSSTTTNGIAKTIEVYSYGYETASRAVCAEFLGGSITKDIAVVKAPLSSFPSDIKAVETADSNQITLGERVVAIGNPMAEGISVTAGIVSVDSEDIEMEALDSASKTILLRVIRTDTAINSGNSGGGLYNARGQLLGIVNAKNTDAENTGFAIPVSVAAGIADCVIENNSKKCILGITVSAVSTQTQYNSVKNKVEIIEAIVVQEVSEGALAQELLAGDKLLSVHINDGDKFSITRLFHLSDYLYKARGGDTIYLQIERGGENMTIQLIAQSAGFGSI